MKISIIFNSVKEGLDAIAVLTGAGVSVAAVTGDDDDTGTPAAPGAVDPALGVELDANGMPWVAEVHAGTKGKNQDGTWKKRKGVSDEARVAGEQKALAHLKATSAPAAAAAPVLQTPAIMGGTVAPGIATGMPGLPVMPAAAALPPVSYEQLTELYAALAGANVLQAQHMVAIYAECGIANPSELGTNESYRRAVYDRLKQIEAAAAQPAAPFGMPGA